MAWSDHEGYDLPPDWRAIRKRVFARDGHRCTKVLPSGKRCPRREHLEANHIVQPYLGGTHDLANLETLCSTHHRRETERQARRARMTYTNEKTPETHPGKGAIRWS